MVISRRKYALNILEETRMFNVYLVETPMVPSVKLVPDQRELVPSVISWENRQLVDKLNYLIVTYPNNVFVENVMSQF